MSWLITPTQLLVDDQDALTYLAAVEAADGQALETNVRLAVNAFVKGCKADGIWNAIKASCILAGARTLNGALVPLVGTAPTNFNFVSGDYNRKTGLAGDGSTKYLDSNRNNNADPQDSKHISIFATTRFSSAGSAFVGTTLTSGGSWIAVNSSNSFTCRVHSSSSDVFSNEALAPTVNCFLGISRNNSTEVAIRIGGSQSTFSKESRAPALASISVFRAVSNSTASRLAFYSIGESLDLALLDARVTTLINAFGAAIP
jgi:hypothetical protein